MESASPGTTVEVGVQYATATLLRENPPMVSTDDGRRYCMWNATVGS